MPALLTPFPALLFIFLPLACKELRNSSIRSPQNFTSRVSADGIAMSPTTVCTRLMPPRRWKFQRAIFNLCKHPLVLPKRNACLGWRWASSTHHATWTAFFLLLVFHGVFLSNTVLNGYFCYKKQDFALLLGCVHFYHTSTYEDLLKCWNMYPVINSICADNMKKRGFRIILHCTMN